MYKLATANNTRNPTQIYVKQVLKAKGADAFIAAKLSLHSMEEGLNLL